MGIVINEDSEYGRELAKWNTPKRQGGYGPNGFELFPLMLYKAFPRNGKAMCGDNPMAYREEAQQLEAESFNRRCQVIVRSPDERDRMIAQGWRETQREALAQYEAEQQAVAQAAAETAYASQRMSEQARAELKEADAATHQHVTDLKSRKKPGRKPKIVSAAELPE